MRIERSNRRVRGRTRAQVKAIRAEVLERVLAVLDEVPEALTVRELRPAIEATADRETIEMLRRFLRTGRRLSYWSYRGV